MPQTQRRLATLLSPVFVVMGILSGCGGGGGSSSAVAPEEAQARAAPAPQPAPVAPPAPPTPPVPPAQAPSAADRVAVGEKLFHDTALSANGRQSCASCHVPERGHADPVGSFLPLGGLNLDQQGLRSSPSLNYLNGNTAFRFDNNGLPRGGFTWDGRADSRAAQARSPLLGAAEMANPNEPAVVAKVRTLSYFNELLAAYRLPNSASDAQVMAATQQALADYQAGDSDYQPFTSKFDAVRAGTATFTAQEARGQAAFNDPNRGNCASCHTSNAPNNGGNGAGNNGANNPAVNGAQAQAPVFTNFGYFALGVPRNTSVATADTSFFDLGLCGPVRSDLVARTDLCGKFKVPTLRNVALTAPYFHNGALKTLDEVLAFYATRDSDAQRWYGSVGGVPPLYNDLPAAYRGNVTQQAPFNRRPGQPAALSLQDQRDIVVFLNTLTDGFTP